MSKGPDGWIDQWRHNALWVFDSPEIAWSVVPVDQREGFDLYAYRIFAVQFVKGERQDFNIPPLNVAPIPESFESLGFDAVSRTCGTSFECSPLSCNRRASDCEVNKYCLVASAETAFCLAQEFSKGGAGAEPGPYYAVEVLRGRESEE